MIAIRSASLRCAQRGTPKSGLANFWRSRLRFASRPCWRPTRNLSGCLVLVAVRAHEVEGALLRCNPDIGVLLFYGPDAGLVAERARAAAEGAVDDPGDPFQLVRIDGDALAADPARLMDE